MKSIPTIYRRLAIFCMLMIPVLSSCTKETVTTNSVERRAELAALLHDDAAITMTFSPAAILKSAGMDIKDNVVKPSKAIERLVASNLTLKKIVNFITSAKGIDYSAAALAGGTDNGCVLFALSDAQKFSKWAVDEGMTISDKGSYIVCYKDIQSPAVVVDGLTAWFIGTATDADKALSIVEKYKAASRDNQIAQWKIDRLIKDDINLLINTEAYSNEMSSVLKNIGGWGSLSNVYSSNCKYSVNDINFEGPSVKMVGEAFDEAGHPTTIFAENEVITIPSSVLTIVKDSQIAFGAALPESWKELLVNIIASNDPENQYSPLMAQCLNALNSITFGISSRDGFSIANLKPSDFIANLIIGYDKPAAEKAIALIMTEAKNAGIENIISEAWNAWTGKTTYTFTPEPSMPDLKLYLTGKDQLAFLSTDSNISEVKLSNDPKMEGLIAFSNIDLKKSHPCLAFANCPFGIESRFISTNEKSEGYITLTETDEPILETLITFISRFI